jgi:NADPH-dependent curcumin reductase
MTAKVNRQWRLASRPVGMANDSNFNLVESDVPELQDGEFLARNVYLSLDPTNRGWLNAVDTYLPAIQIGDIVRGGAIGVVESSRNSRFPEGAIVQGLFGWQDYVVSDGRGASVLPWDKKIPLTTFMGLFGHIGVTAYFGLIDVCKPKEGETLVVSAAAGAVGSLVAQIGKIKGMTVIGIAGGEEKCRWLTEELGIDAAIDYKNESVASALKKRCPKGIDVYFENVGGEMLEAVLDRINIGARISLCGMIAQYNASKPVPGPHNLVQLIIKRARMEGFLVSDYAPRSMEAINDLGMWWMEGKLKFRIDVVDGLENAPDALNKLFDGSNKGKLIVKVSEEPA